MKKLVLRVLRNKKKINTIKDKSKEELLKCKFFGILLCFLFAIAMFSGFIEFTQAKTDEIIVVIDAGHGGNDPGKVSKDNILEKDVNLSIAIKLKSRLEAEGITVIMTREDDRNLAAVGATNKKSSDMKNRVQLINESGAVCVISIHQNSYTDSNVRGGQTFYYSESEDGKNLALEIQKNIKGIDSQNKREAKIGNDYYILRRSACAGVIVECGFLSCPAETALLVSEGYQDKLADAITDAVCHIYIK